MKDKIIPVKFKPYFWDSLFDELDTDKNGRYIISRLYCYGDLDAFNWVNDTYTASEIEDVARNSRDLKPLVANYLRQQFNLAKRDMIYYRTIENTGIGYWR